MRPADSSMPSNKKNVALRAELAWSIAVVSIIVVLLGMMIYMNMTFATMPAARIEAIDPTTLHLAGEFIESNLGSAIESDGSVTIRIVGNQYAFTPQCLLVPTDTPIRFRVTSADVVHGFAISETTINVMLVPGYVSTVRGRFRKLADYTMPCHEFCGIGHAAMWAHVKVIDKAKFFQEMTMQSRQSCVH